MYLWCALAWWSTGAVPEGAMVPWLGDAWDACLHAVKRSRDIRAFIEEKSRPCGAGLRQDHLGDWSAPLARPVLRPLVAGRPYKNAAAEGPFLSCVAPVLRKGMGIGATGSTGDVASEMTPAG